MTFLVLLVASVMLCGALGPFVLSTATLTYWVVVGIAISFRSDVKVSARIAQFVPAFVALGGLVAGTLGGRSTLRNRLSGEVTKRGNS